MRVNEGGHPGEEKDQRQLPKVVIILPLSLPEVSCRLADDIGTEDQRRLPLWRMYRNRALRKRESIWGRTPQEMAEVRAARRTTKAASQGLPSHWR